MAQVISGERLANKVCADVAKRVTRLQASSGVRAALAVILIGNNPASESYVRSKVSRCKEVGIHSVEHRLPASITQARLLELILRLNQDEAIHGILVQLPLPAHIDPASVLAAILPEKDVDGFHPVNVGRLSIGDTACLAPCTALGCLMLLDSVIDDLAGLKAVVIGKSNIVGKPTAMLLLARECTVTVCHIRTRNLPEIIRAADIVVVAAGAPGLLRGDWVKPGAVVIDVGITRVVAKDGSSRIVGDACHDELGHAGHVTPVPGGVGPMTVACLMHNTAQAAQAQVRLRSAAARPSDPLTTRPDVAQPQVA